MVDLLEIKDAVWIKDFLFYVEFNDSTTGVVDFMPLVEKHEMFKQILRDEKPDYFGTESGTITWYNGADIAPEWVKSNLQK